MILAMEEDGYSHLFGYSPAKAKLVRLTYGPWNDVTPGLSPDGKRIAFASNRGGHWDLYVLELQSGQTTQLTNTPEFDSSPTWSPDSAWLAYETYQNGNLQIAILSLTKPGDQPVLLSNDAASDHSPSWAPNGREIAFVSNAGGSADIWVADLNKTENRFTNLTQTPQVAESHPVWSPDSRYLAWAASSQTLHYDGIYVWDSEKPQAPPEWVGDGNWPAWNASGDEIAASVDAANQELVTAFTLHGQPLLLPAPLPGFVRGLVWPKLGLPDPLPPAYQDAAAMTPEALAALPVTSIPDAPPNRWNVVPLDAVQAPYPQLHAQVAQSFTALRERIIREAGWDVLSSLENAYVPLTTALDPGLGQDWLYTGRAFAINSLMVNAGWMAVERSAIGAETYWHLYVRAKNQDGSQGAPIENPPWDLNARYALDPKKYEAGGDYAPVPPGYWIDFTSLAEAYGWERLPALPNWRYYYPGARFTEFAQTDGLDWYSAMLQLYPAEALITPTAVLPPTATPTRTPIPTRTLPPTRTPYTTVIASMTPTVTPSLTPRPSTSTPQATFTPPTLIPTFPTSTP